MHEDGELRLSAMAAKFCSRKLSGEETMGLCTTSLSSLAMGGG